MTDPIPTEAVEAAARAYLRGDRMGVGEHSGRHHSGILSALTAAAPHIAARATADLRTGIEALWTELASAEPDVDQSARVVSRHVRDRLDALLRGAANV